MGSEQAIRLPMTRPNMLASLVGRKWMTRRVMKPQPKQGRNGFVRLPGVGFWNPAAWNEKRQTPSRVEEACPYGAPGTPLVLTETWKPLAVRNGKALIHYRADHSKLWQPMPECAHEKIIRARKHGRWMPPMFMQVWASRAPTVNEEVRVERVQEITEEDAKAEGVCWDGTYWLGGIHPVKGTPQCWPTARRAFQALWDSINATRGYSWETNPWVWVVSFKRVGAA